MEIDLKKKLLLIGILLVSLALSFGIGVLSFSSENLSNASNGLDKVYYSGEQVTLVDWVEGANGYVSGEDSQIVIENVNTYVANLRFFGEFDESVEFVELFYTEKEGEVFSAERRLECLVSRKNSDIYITVGKEVCDIRLDVYPEANFQMEFQGVEINPRKFNVDSVKTALIFIFTFFISYCVAEIISDRKSLVKDLAAMKRYKYLLGDLVMKDIKTKYRRSVLGVLWSVLNPLLMMLVLTAVFSNIIRVEVEGGFALFYLTGYIIFNFISEATGFSLYTITGAAPLIKKVYVPKYIFPLEKCMFSFVNMLFSSIAFVVVFTVFAVSGKTVPHATMLLFPIPLIYTFVFCLGLCLILSSLVVFFRDIGHIWGILLTVWMYASPIIYPISLVPNWLASIIKLNPLYYYIDYFRNIMIYGTLPSLYENVVCILYAVTVFLLGVVVFRKNQDRFILFI